MFLPGVLQASEIACGNIIKAEFWCPKHVSGYFKFVKLLWGVQSRASFSEVRTALGRPTGMTTLRHAKLLAHLYNAPLD